MPTNAKLNRRSVGIQSDPEVSPPGPGAERNRKMFDMGTKFSNLCKKSAYRNLLQRSITVDARGKVNIAFDFINSGRSRATQTILESDLEESDEAGMVMKMKRVESVEVAIPVHPIPGKSMSPSLASEESFHVLEISSGLKAHHDELPGTSRLISPMSLLEAPSLQFEDRNKSVEGSLAVIYSCDDSIAYSSRASNVVYVSDNQTLRRQSDEAVLLVQDYESYDILNTAKRQDATATNRENWRKARGKKRRWRRRGTSTRPVPITPDEPLTSTAVCRICHEGEDVEPLIRPCLCKGSVGSIHAKCLKLWLEQSSTSRCEICGYPYAIRQRQRYTKCVSVTVFLRSVVDRRALMYDLISFVGVTPLCIVGIAMCIRASLVTTPAVPGTSFHMGNVTRAGMIMLSSTIVIAYGVWLYTLLSYHYKTWKRWYSSCYDVEVIPVCMNSEERLDALQKLEEDTRRRVSTLDRGGSVVAVLQPAPSFIYGSFFQRRFPVAARIQELPE